MEVIPYSRQTITAEDESAISSVLQSDYITRGPVTRKLEDALCQLTQKKHCVVVSNGTLALWAAFRAMHGDKIVTSTLTFGGVASAALLLGMDVFFSDVDFETLCAEFEMSLYAEELIYVPMDYGGYPSLRHKLSFPTVLDACHSIGATIDGVSNTVFADIAVGSGHAIKQITGAELGWLVTDSDEYAASLREIRDVGRRDGKFYSVSLNLHTSEVSAGLYLSQLNRLPGNLNRRREIAHGYYSAFGQDLRLILPVDDPGHAWHLFVLRISDVVNCSTDQFRSDLLELGVGTQKHYYPIHLQPLFASRNESFPIAEHAYERMISIPMYHGLTDQQQEKVIEAISIVLDRYSKG